MADAQPYPIHLVSDSTGETLNAVARACLAPFEGIDTEIRLTVFVRSTDVLDGALADLRRMPGPVFYTLVDAEHRARLERVAAECAVPALAVLDPILATLADWFDRPPERGVGMQHILDQAYFARIAALDFAMNTDDGHAGSRLSRADVILTGVSRSSKTPTCVYLAHRGIKAANMPLIPGQEPGPEFYDALAAGVPVIGLTLSPTRLAHIRSQRLESLGDRSPDYADLESVRHEVTEARLFFERHRIPVIDVTRRSIEETAAAIMVQLDRRPRP